MGYARLLLFSATIAALLICSATVRAEIKKDLRVVGVIDTDEEGKALKKPGGVSLDPKTGEVYILDSGRHRVIVCNEFLFPVYTLNKSKGVSMPACLTWDHTDTLYVVQHALRDRRKVGVTAFTPRFRKLYDFYFKGFPEAERLNPKRVAVDRSGRLFVTADGIDGLLILDVKGKYLRKITPVDDFRGEGNEPVNVNDLDIAEDGRMYLVSSTAGRVYVYSPEGELLYKFGEKGGTSGKLAIPMGIALDESASRVYVVDYMRHGVSVFTMKGDFLFEFGGKGVSRGWFLYPSDVAVDLNGRVFIADTFNDRIQVFDKIR